MRVDNTPLTSDPTLMTDIQAEVTNETRPLLQFIVQNAKYIVSVVVLLIVALVSTGVYRYIAQNQQRELQAALAKVQNGKADAAQIKAMEDLLAGCPDRLKTSVQAAIAKSALAQGDFDRAAKAYGAVARSAADTPLGFIASVNEAGALLSKGSYAEGVAILKSLSAKLPMGGVGDDIRVMLAEASARAGDYAGAAQIFDSLAANGQDMQAEYFKSRARDVQAQANAAKEEADATNTTK